MATNGTWEFSDAWLMVAASGAGRRGCELTRLIATADAYNHDIPSEPMVERSIGRLVASGLAKTSDLRVGLTKDGCRLAKQARGRMFERAPKLLELLHSVPLSEGHWQLPSGAWRQAYDTYRQRMPRYM